MPSLSWSSINYQPISGFLPLTRVNLVFAIIRQDKSIVGWTMAANGVLTASGKDFGRPAYASTSVIDQVGRTGHVQDDSGGS
jgi:hypothetical protein